MPTHATVFVAETYPPWQCTVLSALREMYSKQTGPPDNKAVSVELGKKPELKKFMKKVMPFVAFTKERVAQVGSEWTNHTDDSFNDLFFSNRSYLKGDFNLSISLKKAKK